MERSVADEGGGRRGVEEDSKRGRKVSAVNIHQPRRDRTPAEFGIWRVAPADEAGRAGEWAVLGGLLGGFYKYVEYV